ncbi:serine hydrolase domain-containing protein [Paenarthrobacter sp. NPDC089675]|uniref:serine hydrolase domain-containing protein n=1 Tax=Paenarthrobacter sp. NPDC089675 TaxID=3364376 RepID=UPI00382A8694
MPSHANSSPAAIESLDQTMQTMMSQGAVAVVAQVRWPGGEWSKAYGVRDLDTKEPARPGDRVPVASVTKTMTAVCVLKAVDEGLIGLDDPVNALLESFGTGLRPPGPITVRQLLSHTSGMPPYGEALYRTVDDLMTVSTQKVNMQRALQAASTLPWEARSIGSFLYSDSNYVALGLILEKLRGKSFPQILRDDIINPLALTGTTLDETQPSAGDMIKGYITVRGQRFAASPVPEQFGSPSHGVISTMSDMNDFLEALFNGKLISAGSLTEMQKAVEAPYGLGLFVWSNDCKGQPRFFARGGFLDFRTIAMSSADGSYQATYTLAPAPLPSPLEDPDMLRKRDLMSDQIVSALLETHERLFCQ